MYKQNAEIIWFDLLMLDFASVTIIKYTLFNIHIKFRMYQITVNVRMYSIYRKKVTWLKIVEKNVVSVYIFTEADI